MRRIISLIAEIVIGGLLGSLAFKGAEALVSGYDPALFEVGTMGGYLLGVLAGVVIAGNSIGTGGSGFLAFLGAFLGTILVRLAGNPGLSGIASISDLFRVSLLSLVIIGPILSAFGFNLGRGDTRELGM